MLWRTLLETLRTRHHHGTHRVLVIITQSRRTLLPTRFPLDINLKSSQTLLTDILLLLFPIAESCCLEPNKSVFSRRILQQQRLLAGLNTFLSQDCGFSSPVTSDINLHRRHVYNLPPTGAIYLPTRMLQRDTHPSFAPYCQQWEHPRSTGSMWSPRSSCRLSSIDSRDVLQGRTLLPTNYGPSVYPLPQKNTLHFDSLKWSGLTLLCLLILSKGLHLLYVVAYIVFYTRCDAGNNIFSFADYWSNKTLRSSTDFLKSYVLCINVLQYSPIVHSEWTGDFRCRQPLHLVFL